MNSNLGYKHLFFISLASFAVSCGTIRITPTQPQGGNSLPPTTSAHSDMSIGIQMQLKDLEATLNAKTPTNFKANHAKTAKMSSDQWISYDFTRGNINLSEDGGRIVFSVRLTGQATFGMDILTVPSQATAKNITADVNGSILPRIDKNWHGQVDPRANITIQNGAYVNFAGFKVGIAGFLQEHLNDQIPQMASSQAQTIIDSLNLPGLVDGAWRKLNITQEIYTNPPTWIQFVPDHIAFENPVLISQSLIVGLGIGGNLQVKVADSVENRPATPLPNLNLVASIPDTVELNVPVTLSLQQLTLIANQALQNFNSKGGKDYNFKVTSATLGSLGNKLLISVDFRGTKGLFSKSFIGRLYLVGTPHYDQTTRILSAPDLDYDLQTTNVLLQLADWLLNDELRKKLRASAQFDFGKELDQAKDQGNAAVNSFKLPKGFSGNLTIIGVRSMGVEVQDGRIYSVISAKATSSGIKYTPQ